MERENLCKYWLKYKPRDNLVEKMLVSSWQILRSEIRVLDHRSLAAWLNFSHFPSDCIFEKIITLTCIFRANELLILKNQLIAHFI